MAIENVRTTGRRNWFVSRNFVMIWIGGTIARLSEGFLFTTFGLWIFTHIAKTQSTAASAIKGIVIVAFLALFVLGPLAGVFIDRWKDQRHTLLTTSMLRALIALVPIGGAAFMAFAANPAPWMTAVSLISIYLAVFLISALTHFSIPASYVLFVDCVEEEDYSRANGFLLTTSFLAAMFGPPLGILVYSVVGFAGSAVFDGLLYMTTFVATIYISIDAAKLVAPPRQSFFRGCVDGVRFCFKNTWLLVMVLALVLINVWNGVFTQLGLPFINQNLHTTVGVAPVYVPEGFYGPIGISIGLGFAIGSLFFGLIARRGGRASEKRIFSYSLLIAGVVMLVVSRLTTFTPLLASIFLISVLSMGINVVAVPIYLWWTPRHYLGRVRAVVDVATNLSAVAAGGTLMWVVNAHMSGFQANIAGMSFTAIDTIFAIVGIVCILGGVFVVRAMTTSRKTLLPPDITDTQIEQSTREPSVSSKA